MPNTRSRLGFTLLELVIVMAIISILASFIVSAASIARRRGVKAKAEVMIASVETALSLYETDMGDFPDAGNIQELVVALQGPVEDPDWEGPYMEFKEGDLDSGVYVDPWGRPFNYRKGPTWGNTGSFNVWSNGPDGVDNSSDGTTYGDDIYNW